MSRPHYLLESIIAQKDSASAFLHSLGHKRSFRDPSQAVIPRPLTSGHSATPPGCLLLGEEQAYSAKMQTLEFQCRIAGGALRGVCVWVPTAGASTLPQWPPTSARGALRGVGACCGGARPGPSMAQGYSHCSTIRCWNHAIALIDCYQLRKPIGREKVRRRSRGRLSASRIFREKSPSGPRLIVEGGG